MASTAILPTSPTQFGSLPTSTTTISFSTRRRSNMSLTQTYLLAHKARAKLAGEASRPDHDLRRLVLHANTLDGLMLELADAEREQESWFNQSFKGATTPTTSPASPAKSTTQPRHIQWADQPRMEDSDDIDTSSDEDDDSGFGEEEEDDDVEMVDLHSLTRVPSHKHQMAYAVPAVGDLHYDQMDVEVEVEEDDYYDDEDRADLALQRSPSQHLAPSSPPELLVDDVDSDSDDEAITPLSPPSEALPAFSDKHHQPTPAVASQEGEEAEEEDITAAAAAEAADKHSLFSESYYLRPRNPAPSLVTAISVY